MRGYVPALWSSLGNWDCEVGKWRGLGAWPQQPLQVLVSPFWVSKKQAKEWCIEAGLEDKAVLPGVSRLVQDWHCTLMPELFWVLGYSGEQGTCGKGQMIENKKLCNTCPRYIYLLVSYIHRLLTVPVYKQFIKVKNFKWWDKTEFLLFYSPTLFSHLVYPSSKTSDLKNEDK